MDHSPSSLPPLFLARLLNFPPSLHLLGRLGVRDWVLVDECVQTLDTAVRGKDSWIRRGRGEGEGEGEGEERGFEGGEKRGESALFLLTGLEEGKREKEGGREGGREGGKEGESSRERGREGGGYEGEGRESSSYPAITKAWWSHCSPISLRENTTVSKLKCLNTHTQGGGSYNLPFSEYSTPGLDWGQTSLSMKENWHQPQYHSQACYQTIQLTKHERKRPDRSEQA